MVLSVFFSEYGTNDIVLEDCLTSCWVTTKPATESGGRRGEDALGDLGDLGDLGEVEVPPFKINWLRRKCLNSLESN